MGWRTWQRQNWAFFTKWLINSRAPRLRRSNKKGASDQRMRPKTCAEIFAAFALFRGSGRDGLRRSERIRTIAIAWQIFLLKTGLARHTGIENLADRRTFRVNGLGRDEDQEVLQLAVVII